MSKPTALSLFRQDEDNLSLARTHLGSDATDKEINAYLKTQWKEASQEVRNRFKSMSKQMSSDSSDESCSTQKKTTKTTTKKGKTAYVYFINDPEIRNSKSEGHTGKDLIRHLASIWKEMSEEEKQPWKDKSLAEKRTLENSSIDSPPKSTQEHQAKAISMPNSNTPSQEFLWMKIQELSKLIEDQNQKIKELQERL